MAIPRMQLPLAPCTAGGWPFCRDTAGAIVGAVKPGCLALPIDAVHDGVVLVVGDDDRLVLRTIEIDWAQEEFVCVGAGIAAGEQVIVSQVVPAVDGMRVVPTVDQFETERLLGLLGGGEQDS